jgi:hypothetical protein
MARGMILSPLLAAQRAATACLGPRLEPGAHWRI